jgi:hypothetical protein
MRKFTMLILTVVMLMMVSSCSVFEIDMRGEGIDGCEMSFVTDSDGNIDCRELVNRYFTKEEIKILNERVRSIKTVRWSNSNILGQTDWWNFYIPNLVGNNPYLCDIVINEELFDHKYASDTSDAKLFMIQVTLLHELCHVLWSDPDAKPADESVPSLVSRKGHNDEWYYGFKAKVEEFIANNNMQKYRIKSALSKYGYEKFGPEYGYIRGCRSVLDELDEMLDECETCGGVFYNID